MLKKFIWVLIITLIFKHLSYALDETKEVAFLNQVTDFLSKPHVILTTLVPLLWDVLRRLKPTHHSTGFFHDIGRSIRNSIGKSSQFCYVLGDFFLALGKTFDLLLPQNIIQSSQVVQEQITVLKEEKGEMIVKDPLKENHV